MEGKCHVTVEPEITEPQPQAEGHWVLPVNHQKLEEVRKGPFSEPMKERGPADVMISDF